MKLQINKYSKLVKAFLKNRQAETALVTSGVCYILAIVEGCKATVKAVRNTDYAEDVKGDALTPKELMQANWKYYRKTAAYTVGGTVGLVFGGYKFARKVSGLTELVAIYNAAVKDRDEAMLKVLGEKKTTEVLDEVASTRVKRESPKSEEIVQSGSGFTKCLDAFSGIYFRASVADVKKRINFVNDRLLRCDLLSYDEYLDTLVPEIETHPRSVNAVGFNRRNGLIAPRYSSVTDAADEPVLVIDVEDDIDTEYWR